MNETDDGGELALPVQAGFATTMALFFVVDIFGNSLVIWAILTNTKLQNTSNFYLFALAVTDITIGRYKFVRGAVKQGRARQVALSIWDLILLTIGRGQYFTS